MSNDWTGNRVSIFKTMGASNHSDADRQSDDFYATDPAVLDNLSRKYTIPHVVMEPACGEGHLSRWLEEHGHKVYSSDLMDRGYGEQQNFFEMMTVPDDCECILTNPPYKYATEFVLHALEMLRPGGQVVMFLKTTFLETERRYNEIFKNTPPVTFISLFEEPCVPRTQTSWRLAGRAAQSAMPSSYGKGVTKVLQ